MRTMHLEGKTNIYRIGTDKPMKEILNFKVKQKSALS